MRMKKQNRVFFGSEQEALSLGYRPCASCMNNEYKHLKMTLFDHDKIANVLPYDGTVTYFGKAWSQQENLYYFERLFNNIEWKNDEAIIFGKHFITKRKAAWYGDEGYLYTYSNTTKKALPWTKELIEIKQVIEKLTGDTFNSCLLNLYHTGNEGMAWHSDDEASLGKNSVIASCSFGAERRFSFRHKKTKETISLSLENGSVLVMKDATQSNWLHSLPKSVRVKDARINLTFRTII